MNDIVRERNTTDKISEHDDPEDLMRTREEESVRPHQHYSSR